MAKDKNSFVLYTNQKVIFEQLSDEEAGQLIKRIFSYVNDEDPEDFEDRVMQMSFSMLKIQLKQDLKKWEDKRENLSINGRLGGLKSGQSRSKCFRYEANEANASDTKQTKQTKQSEANEAVNVNANVNANVNVDANEKKKNNTSIVKKVFQPPTLDEVVKYFAEKGYTSDHARRAYEYYDTAEWKDSGGNKVKNWKQKFISNWMKDEGRIKSDNKLTEEYDYVRWDDAAKVHLWRHKVTGKWKSTYPQEQRIQ